MALGSTQVPQQHPTATDKMVSSYLATTAAVAAGTTAAAAYIDAKLHLSKDIKQLWMLRSAEQETIRACKEAHSD